MELLCAWHTSWILTASKMASSNYDPYWMESVYMLLHFVTDLTKRDEQFAHCTTPFMQLYSVLLLLAVTAVKS